MFNEILSIVTGLLGYTFVLFTILLWVICKINKSRQRNRIDTTPDGSYVLASVIGFILLLAAGFCFLISANGPGIVLAMVN